MFKVQPVREPGLQAQIASLLGGKYIENTFAFFAGEMEDDFTTVKQLIAQCQFSLTPEKAIIRSLEIAEGSEDDEAVTVLVRAVMSWLDKADVPFIEFDDGAASEEKIRSFSFRRNENGRYSVDLRKFYRSPCHYNKES